MRVETAEWINKVMHVIKEEFKKAIKILKNNLSKMIDIKDIINKINVLWKVTNIIGKGEEGISEFEDVVEELQWAIKDKMILKISMPILNLDTGAHKFMKQILLDRLDLKQLISPNRIVATDFSSH